jgi:hypothetical protein
LHIYITMKLAELIQERGDIQKRIEQLKIRLESNAVKQDKYRTPEDPNSLLVELEGMYTRLERLIVLINETNNSNGFVEILAQRDVLINKINAYRSFITSASGGVNRYTKTEIAIVPNIDVAKFQKKLDEMSQQYRKLETSIQEKNWTTVVE